MVKNAWLYWALRDIRRMIVSNELNRMELKMMIESVHVELDRIETLQGVNGKLSYEEVQMLVKRVRTGISELNNIANSKE